MRGKILFFLGLATGYVLGTRAGRQRYEQIRAGAQTFWNLPPVKSGSKAVQDFAGERVDRLQARVVAGVKGATVSFFTGPKATVTVVTEGSEGSEKAEGAASAKPKPSATATDAPDTAAAGA
jgi:hypothetical protein